MQILTNHATDKVVKLTKSDVEMIMAEHDDQKICPTEGEYIYNANIEKDIVRAGVYIMDIYGEDADGESVHYVTQSGTEIYITE
jgi:L-2-hydroxyglutarate oxidase LhgO